MMPNSILRGGTVYGKTLGDTESGRDMQLSPRRRPADPAPPLLPQHSPRTQRSLNTDMHSPRCYGQISQTYDKSRVESFSPMTKLVHPSKRVIRGESTWGPLPSHLWRISLVLIE